MSVTYSQFACIGAGFSGVGLGAQLKRQYNITDIRIFERESDLGGTWQINRYPGAGCDVPSILYSYSFEPNSDWSSILPQRAELQLYMRQVATKYNLVDKISFSTSVRKCEWIEDNGCWRLHLYNEQTGASSTHESQFLFGGTGLLIEPRQLDVPGIDTFKGTVVHTARWRPDVDLQNKKVVVFGNGCSATQVIPAIIDQTESITQVARSKHWYVPALADSIDLTPMANVTKYAPWTQGLQRLARHRRARIPVLPRQPPRCLLPP